MWSKVIQDYNTLQSQVLSGLQKASSSPSKGKGKEKLDLNDKWREVERELDEFSEGIENGTRKEKQVNERCRKLPLQVRHISASLNDVTDCPPSIPARRPERNSREIQCVHAPSTTAHRRDVRYSGPTWFRAGSLHVPVHGPYNLTAEFVEGPREGRREEAPTARGWRRCGDQWWHDDQEPATRKTGHGRWARGWKCNATEGPWHAEAEGQRRKVVLALLGGLIRMGQVVRAILSLSLNLTRLLVRNKLWIFVVFNNIC